MVYIVVHLYSAPGAKLGMKKYEEKALSVFRRHGGEVVAAFIPKPNTSNEAGPDEIQILRIPSQESFNAFLNDPERLAMAEERNSVIRKTEVFISKEPVLYEARINTSGKAP